MTDDPVAPPYAADTRAKGWRFELDLERIRQSDTWALAAPELRPWLLMLWAVAWEQTPCGSMPAEPGLIAARIGMAPKAFERNREVLLRGWWKASDGRIYHRVMSERVAEMVDYRDREKARRAGYREKMERERAGAALVPRADDVTTTVVTRDNTVEDATGTGTGTSKRHRKPSASSSAGPTARPTIPCPYDAIVEHFHQALPTLPRVRLMSPARQKALRKTWAWVLTSSTSTGRRRAETAEQALQWFDDYFRRASENDFLMGRTPRGPEHANWQPDLDFLLTDKGMKQVIEKTQAAAA